MEPPLAGTGDTEKHLANASVQAEQSDAISDDISRLQFALIVLALCLAILLVALVSPNTFFTKPSTPLPKYLSDSH
jgi:hypothetical protein